MMAANERVRILKEAGPDKWVAFSADESRLVGTGNTLAEALQKAKEQGELDPVILKTPDSWLPRVLFLCA